MAVTLNSPGIFLNENDSSQITTGPIAVGAALVGPTVKGPVNIPTVVTTYSDFKSKFGASFVDPLGTTTEYLTSIAAYNYFQQGGSSLLVSRVVNGAYAPATSVISGSVYSGSISSSFVLETLSQGSIMNNLSSDYATAGTSASLYSGSSALVSGSSDNIRWEITAANTSSGQFSLSIRQGNDYEGSKTVLESWNNLSLDPNSPNYIEYVIGNQASQLTKDGAGVFYLATTGSYSNNSRYVRVKSVPNPTPNYLDPTGKPKEQYIGLIPAIGSGSYFGGFTAATGDVNTSVTSSMFENIPTLPNLPIQGVVSDNYTSSISALSNKDLFQYNVVYMPGVTLQNATTLISTLVSNTQQRGDAIAVIDTVGYNQPSTNTAIGLAQTIDSSYAATYYPWLQMRSQETGKLVFCPPSTVVPAAYEFNDRVGQPWFAPAGINRGALPTVVQPERRLTVSDRDILYQGKVNPIGVLPGQGTVILGQKTLQSSNSALNRVNVRRLLIELKSNINQISSTLLFEPNTTATRNSFLNQVNPYLQFVQQKQGLFAFQVVMDETNNTADVIDRNQLVGAIYLQPTRTSEFIIVDFNITPTGATFGA
jgi:phage tail sheath protein FI